MVEYLDSDKLAGSHQLSGRIQVFLARVGRSSRVIVGNDNAVSVIQHGRFKYLTRVNEACREGSMTYNVIPDETVSGAEV